jgi:P22 coat protein - gene protein 5
MAASTNTLITPTIIAKEALFQLKNNLVMGELVHRDYSKEYVKVGSTISIRKPVKFRSTLRSMCRGTLCRRT